MIDVYQTRKPTLWTDCILTPCTTSGWQLVRRGARGPPRHLFPYAPNNMVSIFTPTIVAIIHLYINIYKYVINYKIIDVFICVCKRQQNKIKLYYNFRIMANCSKTRLNVRIIILLHIHIYHRAILLRCARLI